MSNKMSVIELKQTIGISLDLVNLATKEWNLARRKRNKYPSVCALKNLEFLHHSSLPQKKANSLTIIVVPDMTKQ